MEYELLEGGKMGSSYLWDKIQGKRDLIMSDKESPMEFYNRIKEAVFSFHDKGGGSPVDGNNEATISNITNNDCKLCIQKLQIESLMWFIFGVNEEFQSIIEDHLSKAEMTIGSMIDKALTLTTNLWNLEGKGENNGRNLIIGEGMKGELEGDLNEEGEEEHFSDFDDPLSFDDGDYTTNDSVVVKKRGKSRIYPVTRKQRSQHPCDKCDQIFNSGVKLKKHCSQDHKNNLEHICEHCGQAFKMAKSLKSHIERIHKKEKKVLCTVCGKKFSNHAAYYKHNIRDHLKTKVECEFCGKMYPKLYLSEHVMQVHKQFKVECKQCKRPFSSRSGLRKHIETAHNKTRFNCPYCDQTYGRTDNMKVHIRKHHKDIVDPHLSFPWIIKKE